MVLREGAETVGAVIVEPVQNSGGCLVAEPAYFARLREICDEHDLLLISDEVICSWGRLGSWFGCEELSYQPDLITTAKGLTSGYAPLGAVIASDRVAEPFLAPGARFAHGLTFAGHPGAAAAALESIAIIEEEDLLARARSVGARFRAALDELYDVPIVGDVRGMAMFQAVELVADQETKAPFDERQLTLLADRVPAMLFERGLICRAMNRRAPVIQFAPPLISEVDDLEWAAATVRDVLTELTPEVM
jgi:adenosylmethionine-8-amino-7-oxononanoate aminotransferase